MAAIEIDNLSKDYLTGFWRRKPRRVLEGLSLRVEQGEVFGFLGHNGAGKTTTLKILTGLIAPTEGSASILGSPVGTPETFNQVGYLPENPYFYDYLTPDELLDYFGRFYPLSADERGRRRDEVLEQVGLTEFRRTALRKFSKGMLQRIGIAQAVLHDPQIVLLDEPMSGLDPVGRRDVRNLIIHLKQQGKTIFFSTHILSDAEALCDRVAILSRGKLVGVGKIAELLKRESGYEAIVEADSAAAREQIERLASKPAVISGGHIRLEVSEGRVAELYALCASGGVRLIALNPLRFSLEDYFVGLLDHTIPAQAESGGRPRA